jgi:VWFA-related protein
VLKLSTQFLRLAFSITGGSLVLGFALGASGQSGRQVKDAGESSVEEVDDNGSIKVRTDEVLLHVTVRDQSGTLLTELQRDRFLIYDERERQEILGFHQTRVPLKIVLLLDASQSAFSHMRAIREASTEFLKRLDPDDQISVIQFSDRVELLQNWTPVADQRPILKALEWRYHPGSSTTFYDGLYLAATEQLARVEGRKVVVLVTDGIDTADRIRISAADAINAIRRSEASVYVVSFTENLRAALAKSEGGWLARVLGGYDPKQAERYRELIGDAETRLEKIALETGGRMYLPRDDKDIAPALDSIIEEFESQYVITFKPSNRARKGEYRRLRVLVTPGGFEISTRQGYVGRS